jgi:hypothetical protein
MDAAVGRPMAKQGRSKGRDSGKRRRAPARASNTHKNNHYIPKFMLRYWATRPAHKNYEGVFVYHIERHEKKFENAQGGGERSHSRPSTISTFRSSIRRARLSWRSGWELPNRRWQKSLVSSTLV